MKFDIRALHRAVGKCEFGGYRLCANGSTPVPNCALRISQSVRQKFYTADPRVLLLKVCQFRANRSREGGTIHWRQHYI